MLLGAYTDCCLMISVWNTFFRKKLYLRRMKDLRAYILGLCDKKEGYVVEFKSAKGGFPGTFWDTYSSFANTAGGIIVLGIREKDNKFVPDGLTEEQDLQVQENLLGRRTQPPYRQHVPSQGAGCP